MEETIAIPEVGTRIQFAYKDPDTSEIIRHHNKTAEVLGPSTCGEPTRIAVRHDDGSVDLVRHASRASFGAIGWQLAE
jgi:hypothetical protein